MLLIDGHLDIAMNALEYERDQTLTVEAIRRRETPAPEDDRGTCMVSLPELRASNAAVVTATLFARTKPGVDPRRKPGRNDSDWPSQDMTHAVAAGQLAYYELLHSHGELRLIGTRQELDEHLDTWDAAADRPVGVIVMMEGADPITRPEEVQGWHAWGVRCVSLAHFGHSRYACGTPPRDPTSPEKDGPLKPAARDLLREMAALPMALDLSHMSDRSFAEAADLFDGPICATHSNCRALADTPRQITDEQIRRIVERDGVIGVAIHNGMLATAAGDRRQTPPREEVSLSVVADHIQHVCDLAGGTAHVGIGSDLDGGYGREKTPREMDTHRDLHRLAPLLRDRGFGDADVEAFFHGNWLRFWRRVLPIDAS